LTNSRLNGGFMLDGFPRNLAQAKALDAWLMEQGKPLEAVIFFDGPESLMVERITGRRVCPQCGHNYHEQDMRPKVAGICDVCGATLIQREDDREAVVRKRCQIYRRETEPLADYYRR